MCKLFLLLIMVYLLLDISVANAACIRDEQRNKKVVTTFYNLLINEKNYEAAAKYLGHKYTQHNPTAEDGRKGLKKFVKYLRNKYPRSHSEIIRVFTDGNFVILHVYSVRIPGSSGRAIMDIFRLQCDKIVEHWDVIQNIPVKSANSNTMFYKDRLGVKSLHSSID